MPDANYHAQHARPVTHIHKEFREPVSWFHHLLAAKCLVPCNNQAKAHAPTSITSITILYPKFQEDCLWVATSFM